MNKKEIKPKQDKESITVYSIIALLSLFLFVLLVPKVSSLLFPFKRMAVWNNFLSQIKKGNKIDPQRFWEFREFYSPGYFTQDKSASDKKVKDKLRQYRISTNSTFSTLLAFESPKSKSIDTLTSDSQIKKIIGIIPTENRIFQNDTTAIYKLDEKHVVITFLLPVSEMKKANGFFDYEKDKDLLNNKNWYSITEIELP